MQETSPRLYAFFATLIYCAGCARGEAIGLRWSDIDLDQRLIIVRHSYDGPTKSGKDHEVPIPLELVPILAQHPLKGELAFPDEAGQMYKRSAHLRDVLFAALAAAKLKRIRLHDLRHVYASQHMMTGGNTFDRQKNLATTPCSSPPRRTRTNPKIIGYERPIACRSACPGQQMCAASLASNHGE